MSCSFLGEAMMNWVLSYTADERENSTLVKEILSIFFKITNTCIFNLEMLHMGIYFPDRYIYILAKRPLNIHCKNCDGKN